jgi:hypothetical protein
MKENEKSAWRRKYTGRLRKYLNTYRSKGGREEGEVQKEKVRETKSALCKYTVFPCSRHFSFSS